MKRLFYIVIFVLFALTVVTAFSVRSDTPQQLWLFAPAEGTKERLTPQQEKIDPLLRQVRARMKDLGVTRENAVDLRVSEQFSSPLIKVDEKARVQVYIELAAVNDAVLETLKLLEVEIEIVNEELRIVQGWVPFDRVEALAGYDFVRRVRPPDYGVPRTGSVTSQGDFILRANEARSRFGVDGRGVRVGVISDGANNRASAQFTGDLPPDISIFGLCDPATTNTTCNEGTAMLEIVYDLAPGATLGFCSGLTTLQFINCVNTLTFTFGAKVIVDDIGFPTEPYFQDGPVARAVADAVANGVVYVSAAGNDAQQHYEANFVGSGVSIIRRGEAHNFGAAAGGTSDISMDVLLNPSEQLVVRLQWNDLFGASANDYDLFIMDNTETFVLASSENRQDGDDDPLEIMLGTNPFSVPGTVKVVVTKVRGDNRLLEMYLSKRPLEYNVTAGSIFGHPAVPGVLATAAVDASDPGNDNVESFSSRGLSTIFFPSFVQRQKPDVAAVDGVSVTGAGGFKSPFFGTSAAAPHAAGVAALLLGANRTLTPAQVRQTLTSTARDIETPGVDLLSGAGLIDAFQAVSAVSGETSPVLSVTPTSPNFGSVPVGSSTEGTFTVSNTGGGTLMGSASTSAPFSIASGGSFSLGAGQSQTVTVRFSPTSTGTFSGMVSFSSNGGNASVTVTGTGLEGTTNTAPFGYIDVPAPGATVQGSINVEGWVLDREDSSLTVELLVDGNVVSSPPSRFARPDVCANVPSAPPHCASSNPGVRFSWNTTTVSNGSHSLAFRVTDPQGASATVGSRTVTVTLSLRDHTMTGGPIPDECARPPAKFTFAPTDAQVYQWTLVSGAAVGDVVRWEWIQPDGSLYSPASATFNSSGNVCAWAGINIAGTPAATLLGDWQVRVSYNGTQILTETFTINTAPFGYIDVPAPGATVQGSINVEGWVLDREDSSLTVELLVDGGVVSSSPSRFARPDVCANVPSAPPHCASSNPGVRFSWDTTTVANGAHTLAFGVTDPQGASARVGSRTVTVNNTGGNVVIFQGNMENGINGWSTNDPWAQTTASSHSPTHSWTDSPSGNYQNNLNVSLFSPVINLAGLSSASLTFWHRFDFGSGDAGNVWVRPVGGDWVFLRSFTGTDLTWHQDIISLNAFLGQSIVIAFQLVSDSSVTADGWYIDDVVVTGR